MEPVLVVGAGISGVACARALADAGVPVSVLERSHRPGGRMASRRLDGRRVDLGASYFTVSDDRFAEVVDRWERSGLARPWTDTFHVRDEDGAWETRSGPVRWGAPRGLRSLVEDLAAGLDVETTTVEDVVLVDGRPCVDGRMARAVVLAMPDPQAARLLGPSLADVAQALDDPFEPILALTATWEERSWEPDGVFVNGSAVVSWVADDGRRRGDGAAVLVAHSTPQLARGHLEDPDAARPELVAELRALLDLPEPERTEVHRWTFAKPAGTRDEPFLLTDSGVGCCGDAWSSSPKVESAYLSGHRLGLALASRWG